MRPLYVPVRLAATMVAVAAAAGCMSVGEDGAGSGVRPSHPAGRTSGAGPDGGPAVSGEGAGYGTAAGEGERPGERRKGHKDKDKDEKRRGRNARAAVSPSPGASRSGPHGRGPDRPAKPTPDDGPVPPEPTRTHDPEPTDPPPQPSASPEPTVPEPSSSAHEPPEPQLEQREPVPKAGAPAWRRYS